jgi:hypothetical protein
MQFSRRKERLFESAGCFVGGSVGGLIPFLAYRFDYIEKASDAIALGIPMVFVLIALGGITGHIGAHAFLKK